MSVRLVCVRGVRIETACRLCEALVRYAPSVDMMLCMGGTDGTSRAPHRVGKTGRARARRRRGGNEEDTDNDDDDDDDDPEFSDEEGEEALLAAAERDALAEGDISCILAQLENVVCRVAFLPSGKDPPCARREQGCLTPNSVNVFARCLPLIPRALYLTGFSEEHGETGANTKKFRKRSAAAATVDEKPSSKKEAEEDEHATGQGGGRGGGRGPSRQAKQEQEDQRENDELTMGMLHAMLDTVPDAASAVLALMHGPNRGSLLREVYRCPALSEKCAVLFTSGWPQHRWKPTASVHKSKPEIVYVPHLGVEDEFCIVELVRQRDAASTSAMRLGGDLPQATLSSTSGADVWQVGNVQYISLSTLEDQVRQNSALGTV